MSDHESKEGLQVVFGSGPVGSATTRYLVAQGFRVRLVSRSGRRPPLLFDDLTEAESGRLEFLAADIGEVGEAARAGAGASHLYHCVNLPYQDWSRFLPRFQDNLIAAAQGRGAVLAVSDNLYSYSRGTAVIDVDAPEDPPTRKGALRKSLHEALERAGRERGLVWAAVRASDYYGPGAMLQSLFGASLFLEPLFRNRRPNFFGSLDQPHSLTYVGDFGRALATAALDPAGHGRTWIVPNDRTRTARETARMFITEAGIGKIPRILPRTLIAAAGIFNPLLAELGEMLYQKEEPYIVDGRHFAERFDFSPTPLEEGIRRTIAWYRAFRDAGGIPAGRSQGGTEGREKKE